MGTMGEKKGKKHKYKKHLNFSPPHINGERRGRGPGTASGWGGITMRPMKRGEKKKKRAIHQLFPISMRKKRKAPAG